MEVGTTQNKFALLIAETFGTATFLSAIFYSALYQTDPLTIGVGVGGGLFIAILIFGGITGGHFNPAVSIAYYAYFIYDRTAHLTTLLILLISQVLGGLIAGSLLYLAASKNEPVLKPDEENLAGSFFDEVFFTLLFLAVIFTIKTKPPTSDGVLQALCVCITLSLCVVYGGKISGACYNPAVGIAMNFWAAFSKHETRFMKYTSFYIMAPIIGGLIAGAVVRFFTNRKDEILEKNDEEDVPLKSK